MSDILTYTLSLQENITSKLKQIGIANTQQLNTWASVESSVNSAERTMSKMGRSIGSLRERVNALKSQKEWIPASNKAAIRATNHEVKALEKEIEKLNNLNGGKLKKWFGDIKNSIPAFVNPITAAIAGIGKTVQIGMEAELQKTNLRTLFKGNEEAALSMYDKISQYNLSTPYQKTDLIEGQKLMMSFGIQSEKSFEKLRQIGDIAMGDSRKMQSLSLAFSQATSAGKLQGQDLLQMINAGFNPLQVISERTGESMADLKKRMAQGKISADELSKAFKWATDEQGLFYKGAEKASETLKGKVSNFMDKLSEMTITLYENILSPLFKPIVDLASTVLGKLYNGLQWLIELFKKGNPIVYGLAFAFGVITTAFILYSSWQKTVALWTTIITVFKYGEATAWWAATAPMFLTIGVIALIIAAIVAVVGIIIYSIKHVTGWGDTWQNITSYMGLAMEVFRTKVSLVWLNIKDSFLTGFEIIEKGWYKLQSLWDKESAQKGLSKLENDRNNRAKEIAATQNKVEALKKQMNSMSVWAIKTDGTSLKDFVGKTRKIAMSSLGTNAQLINAVSGNNGSNNLDLAGGNGGKSTTNAIASGGTRNTNIHISIKSMIESLVMQGNTGENAQEIERNMAEAFYRMLNMANVSV